MRQNDVFEWLKNEYDRGNRDFFTIKQIGGAFPGCAYINRLVVKLYAWGYLDVLIGDNFKRSFRIKEKYTGGVTNDKTSKAIKEM